MNVNDGHKIMFMRALYVLGLYTENSITITVETTPIDMYGVFYASKISPNKMKVKW